MPEESTISDSTKYSGRLFWVIICTVAAGAVWATKIDSRLANIEEFVNQGSFADRWRGRDMERWTTSLDQGLDSWVIRLKADNPNLVLTPIPIPKIYKPSD